MPNVSVNKTTTSLFTLKGILESSFWGAMNEKLARLQAIQNNIARYEGLLKSSLNETELRFVNRRLLEERRALTMLRLISPSNPSQVIRLPFPDALL
jgi:hypothetical protein